jgi:hypothetical protein
MIMNKQAFSKNFYNKQEISMNLCNFQQFLKLSKLNKYLLRFLYETRIFFEFVEKATSFYMNFENNQQVFI